MKRFYVLFAVLLITIAGLSAAKQQAPPQQSFTPVTDEMLWKPSPNDWLTRRRTLDSYSPLKEIDRSNVSRLKMMWSRGIVGGRTQEATPLVYNGTMYIPNPGDIIMAIDDKTGDLKWEYNASTPKASTAAPIATWQCGAIRSSMPALTTPSTRSTPGPVPLYGTTAGAQGRAAR